MHVTFLKKFMSDIVLIVNPFSFNCALTFGVAWRKSVEKVLLAPTYVPNI